MSADLVARMERLAELAASVAGDAYKLEARAEQLERENAKLRWDKGELTATCNVLASEKAKWDSEARAERLETALRESDAAQARIERMVAGMIRLGALVGLPETAKVFEMECRLQDLVAAEARAERLEAALREFLRLTEGRTLAPPGDDHIPGLRAMARAELEAR